MTNDTSGEGIPRPSNTAPGERPVSVGFYNNAAKENQAHRLFSSFTPEEFALATSRALADLNGLLKGITEPFAIAQSENLHPFKVMEYRSNAKDLQRMYHGQREIVALYYIINHINGDYIVRSFPDRFRQLIDSPEEKLETMLEKHVGDEVDQMQKALQLSLLAAFTPPRQRGIINREDWKMFREHEFNQIIEYTPDLTGAKTSDDKLDAIINMLIPPTGEKARELHQIALAEECHWAGINPQDLDKNNPEHKAIFARAGRQVLAMSGNLSAAFLDSSGQGYGPIFKVHPETHGGEIRTDHKGCPAAPMVHAYLEGFGMALRDNRQNVLEAIERFDVLNGTKI